MNVDTTHIHTPERLKELQALPLERKVGFTAARIAEWYTHYEGNVYVSFSGGKDSTVLLHIARTLYPDIKAVYADTGLEYPEIKAFVKTFDNVDIVRPKKSFKQVLEEYGYPVISKEVAHNIHYARRGSEFCKYKLGMIDLYKGKPLDPDNPYCTKNGNSCVMPPFKISPRCCDVIKKEPLKRYEREHNKSKPIVASMTTESMLRRTDWFRHGCNAFDAKHPKAKPMSFWTEQDVLQYIKLKNIPICSVYGDIVETTDSKKRPKLVCTGLQRTGCMFCMFGVHCEKSPNRFQKMKQTHPQLWDYCINKLNLKQVLDYINVPYEPEPTLFDETEIKL